MLIDSHCHLYYQPYINNIRETLDICARAYIVGEGHVIAEGTTTHILSDQKVRQTYLGDIFTM